MKSRLIRRLGMLGAAIGLAALAFASTTASASVPAKQEPAAAPALAGSLLVAGHSGLCVAPAVGQLSNGVAIVQDNCISGNDTWRWTLRPLGGNINEIRSAADPNKCLDVLFGVGENSVITILFDCHGGFNQHWHVTETGGGFFEFRNRQTGRCLDVASAKQHIAVPMQQFDCHNGSNQRFRLG